MKAHQTPHAPRLFVQAKHGHLDFERAAELEKGSTIDWKETDEWMKRQHDVYSQQKMPLWKVHALKDILGRWQRSCCMCFSHPGKVASACRQYVFLCAQASRSIEAMRRKRKSAIPFWRASTSRTCSSWASSLRVAHREGGGTRVDCSVVLRAVLPCNSFNTQRDAVVAACAAHAWAIIILSCRHWRLLETALWRRYKWHLN